MYITHDDFACCGSDMSPQDFYAYLFKAERILDEYTTGVDSVRKLEVAFPTREHDREAVRRCICELIMLLDRIDKSESAQMIDAEHSHGAISSVSSGSESISYTSAGSAVNAAVGSLEARRELFRDTISLYLRNAQDANGVNLMYMGVYPCTVTR